MSVNDSWKMYISVLISCSVFGAVIIIVENGSRHGVWILGLIMVLGFSLSMAIRKKPKWVNTYLMFMIAGSLLVTIIGLTRPT